jgi:hypothetical protein
VHLKDRKISSNAVSFWLGMFCDLILCDQTLLQKRYQLIRASKPQRVLDEVGRLL